MGRGFEGISGFEGGDEFGLGVEEEDDVEGRKDMDNVPEKRTTDTESAIGRIAVKGLG